MLKAESEPVGYPIGAVALTAAAVSPLQFLFTFTYSEFGIRLNER
jgi:hypothetical protein